MKAALCHVMVLFFMGCSSGNIGTSQSNGGDARLKNSSDAASTNINPKKEMPAKASSLETEMLKWSSPHVKTKVPQGDMAHKTSKEHLTPPESSKEQGKPSLNNDVSPPLTSNKKPADNSAQKTVTESITNVTPEPKKSSTEERTLPKTSQTPVDEENTLNNISEPQTGSTAQQTTQIALEAHSNEALLESPQEGIAKENVKPKSTKKWNMQRRVSSNKDIEK